MLPFNRSFKRKYRGKFDPELLDEYENISAFYYQLYLERMGKIRKPDPQKSIRNVVIQGLGLYSSYKWKKLNINSKYNKYLKSRQYAYKEGGIIQGTNLPIMLWYHTKLPIPQFISWYKDWRRQSKGKLKVK